MCGTDMRQDLTLTPRAESSCGCCSTPATTTTATTTKPAAASGTASDTVYELEGLTCGSCVRSVEKAVLNVVGVDSVAVSLTPGSASTLSVAGSATPETVRAAVVAAGYTVV